MEVLEILYRQGSISETEFYRRRAQLEHGQISRGAAGGSHKRLSLRARATPVYDSGESTTHTRARSLASPAPSKRKSFPSLRGIGEKKDMQATIVTRSPSPRSSFRSQASTTRAASIRGLFTGNTPTPSRRHPNHSSEHFDPTDRRKPQATRPRVSVVVTSPGQRKRSMSTDDLSPRIKSAQSPPHEEEKSPERRGSHLSPERRRSHLSPESRRSNLSAFPPPRKSTTPTPPKHRAPPPPPGRGRTAERRNEPTRRSKSVGRPLRTPSDSPFYALRTRQTSSSILESGTTVKRRLFGSFGRRASSNSRIVLGSSQRGSFAGDGTTILQGTIAFVPSRRDPGWIASEMGMFRILPDTVDASAMVVGQVCSFTGDVDSTASNIEIASNIPANRVDSFFDRSGRVEWNAPFYVMHSYLAPRGTLTHNEFLAFERFNVLDDDLQDDLEETLNAFINTEGGTIYIGVQKGENVVVGVLLTRDEQVEMQRMIDHITRNLWKPEIPDFGSRVSLTFVPVCLNDGEICRDFFVIRISIQGPLLDGGGTRLVFSYKRNNLAFRRQLSWNVALSKYDR